MFSSFNTAFINFLGINNFNSAISLSQLQSALTEHLGSAVFSGGAVQSIGASSGALGGVSSGSSVQTSGFTGDLSSSSGASGKVVGVNVSSMTAAVSSNAVIGALSSFAANPAVTGFVDVAHFVRNSASNSSGTLTFSLGSEIYSGTANLASGASSVFTSTTNAARTIIFVNSAAHADENTFATNLNGFLSQSGNANGSTSANDVSYPIGAIGVTLDNGDTYSNSAVYRVGTSGNLTLASGTKTITVNVASNSSGLTSSAAQTKANLTTTLSGASFYTASTSGSISAGNLSADILYGFTDVVRGSSGFIWGPAESVSVEALGSKYEIIVKIGGQSFKGSTALPSNNGSLILTSTTDSENQLVFGYGSSVSTSITDEISFEQKLATFLGLKNASAPAIFVPDSGSTGGGGQALILSSLA